MEDDVTRRSRAPVDERRGVRRARVLHRDLSVIRRDDLSNLSDEGVVLSRDS